MTDSTKSLLKSTILGLLGGGAVSALYAINNSKKEQAAESEFKENEITVPLSRRNFLKAVRPERFNPKATAKPKSDTEPKVQIPDTSTMTPKDLASLKKALLRKKASSKCSSKIKEVTSPSSHETPVRNIAGAGSTFLRDEKGRFKADLDKKAGILDDASGTISDSVGMIGGLTAGLALTKMISDRIQINKKKKQVEAARKRYVDSLTKEVNDEDLPYYNKAAEDRGIVGSTLGLLGLAGLTAGTAAGVVMYRIMENRRKEAEKEKDKDLVKYPQEKAINFRFPRHLDEKNNFFA